METRALFFGLRNNEDGGGYFGAECFPDAAAHDEGPRTPANAPSCVTPCLCDSHARQRLPLDVIAQILGHDNLDVTAHYAQVATRAMMDTYNSAHPHAKIAA
jgi:hypothetical protein